MVEHQYPKFMPVFAVGLFFLTSRHFIYIKKYARQFFFFSSDGFVASIETEKYAHVTFFFNGGVEKQFEGETRSMVPSPKVATYDLKPEMNAAGVGEEVKIKTKKKSLMLFLSL